MRMKPRREIITVGAVNQYIKQLMQSDDLLNGIMVRGEISNFTRHSSGHLYFSLKDSSGSMKCVMFRGNAGRLDFQPEHGMEVIAAGYVSVFERDGVYQLYVEEMMAAGSGALHVAYEQLKVKLTAEGLFQQEHKRPLPFFPRRVGVVTSPTGAAIRDILSILHRRNKLVDVYVIPAVVQGAEGVESLCTALERMYEQDVDVIIVGRGGGSLEELWCFNEEQVVRKIAASPVPIISAVGHETDFTLADFAADVRAATPSMAAELAVPVLDELKEQLEMKSHLLEYKYRRLLEQKKLRLEQYAQHRLLRQPEQLLQSHQQRLDQQMTALEQALQRQQQQREHRLALAAERLDGLSPLKVFSRGYSLCQDMEGRIIRSASQLKQEQQFQITLNQGMIYGYVVDKEE